MNNLNLMPFSFSSSDSRRDMIALATIAILGQEGSRALSHRRVDKYLGFPEGSTSFYCRRREDLLQAGFRKLIDLDVTNLTKFFAPVYALMELQEPVEIRLVAKCHHNYWKHITFPENGWLIIARFEFFLLGARDGEVRKFQESILKDLFGFGAKIFKALGARQPNWAGLQYMNLIRSGIMTQFLVPAAVIGFEASPDYFERQFKQIIDAANLEKQDLPD